MDDNLMINVYGYTEYRLIQLLLADTYMLPFHTDLRRLIPSIRTVQQFQSAFTLACHRREKGPIYYKTVMAIVHTCPNLINHIVRTMTIDNIFDILRTRISYNIYLYLRHDTDMYHNKEAMFCAIREWLQRCLRK